MKKIVLLKCLILALTSQAFAQRSDTVSDDNRSRKQAAITIRINETAVRTNDPQSRRLLELERAVRDLQARVFDLEEQVYNNQNTRPIIQGPVCSLLGVGNYGSYYYNYRITIDGNTVDATDSFTTALSTIEQLKETGLCSKTSANNQCVLLGAGRYGSYYYNFRIGLKNLESSAVTEIAGTDSRSTALDMIQKLKAAGLCQ